MSASPTRPRLLILAGIWLLVSALGGGPGEAAQGRDNPAASPRPHLILISMDTTRPDHLSVYGYPLSTTPNLRRFAERAVVFDNARTVVPITGPSHATIFTALYPHQHGTFRNAIPLKKSAYTLAERLREEGYETAAFVSGWTLRGDVSGLDQGFETYDDNLPRRYKMINHERVAEETTAAVETFLSRRRSSRPLFLFVHYFDPHDPYRKHEEFARILEREERGLGLNLEEKVLAYDTEIAYMDRAIGRLLDLLERSGLLRDAVTLILADHGESLGEHDYWGHGRRIYEPNIRIPMILYAPDRIHESARIEDPVSTLDVTPTLLSLLGIEPHGGDFDREGTDLTGLLLRGVSEPGRRIYFETFKGTLKGITKIVTPDKPASPLLIGYYEKGLKCILHPSSSRLEVFDLTKDPNETTPLPSGRLDPQAAERLMSWFEKGKAPERRSIKLSPEQIERLRSLGYVD